MTGKSNVSICIDCSNSVGFCPWSAHFEPITGWKAEKIKRFDGKRVVDSFKVIECPMFESERGRREWKEILSTFGTSF